MPRDRRFFYWVGFLCLLAGVCFWLRSREDAAKSNETVQSASTPKADSRSPSGTTGQKTVVGGQPTAVQPAALAASGIARTATAAPNATPAAASPLGQVPYRLSNTDRSLSQLGRSDTAILLENALIDTGSRRALAVPEHLRASGDPGSYLVQSRRPLDKSFYDRLGEAGAVFVSYIPNNAALVRVSADGARLLAAMSGTRAVLPYEPYYKLARALLPLAVEQQSLPLDQPLNITLFAGERDNLLPTLRDLGAEPVSEEPVPSGLMLTVRAHPDSLVALAQLPGVQRIELAHARVLLNDLLRTRMNISTDTVGPANYLDLTGTNVTLNLNDSGADQNHPDLVGRLFFSNSDTNLTATMQDPEGHGTHVAGTMISSGANSTNLVASGSVPGASFRGMAPAASLFVLPIDLRVGPLVSDTYLQQTAASNNFISLGRTNAIISNNSWAYTGAFEYNSASASYDAAVRDALPGKTGQQPMLYVFAAGNSGFGDDSGTVGNPDSVPAPATAKNVITVGAMEQLRNITNYYTNIVVTGTNSVVVTNTPFLGFTDSANVVASFSSRGNVGIGIEGVFGRVKPDVVAPGAFVVSTRSSSWLLDNSVPPTDPVYPILSSLNSSLAPYYRYETGTSMAAPGVSGALALMQEFFEQRLKLGFSPALLKALLINGARSVNPDIPGYDLGVTNAVKIQGWGLVNLTNSLPSALTNADHTTWPLRFFDQSVTNTLSTGQRHTWTMSLSPDGQQVPLRVTLVWTDPPGNPGAGVKLVNDLDLVVTNLDTGDVFLGNGIPTGFSFNPPVNTNAPGFDFVNNVENVILRPTLGTNYSITVAGRRVNVNAVTANTNDVVQDYALVVASGDGELASPFAAFTGPVADVIPPPPIIAITNGVTLLHQRVGANFQLAPLLDGEAEQWRFYVFTNFFFTNNTSGLTNGSNVAFITFPDGNLALPRNLGPDIDLYVSADPALTNLNAAVIAGAFKSLNRGGTEAVVFTNAAVGLDKIFYIGVKSEDQQAADFGIVGFSSDQPFATQDPNGNHLLRGLPPSAAIPDGSADAPGGVRMFAVDPLVPVSIARVIVTNDITHQSMGDLVGNLSFANHFAVLNNHNRYGGVTNTFFHLVYDDSNSGQFYLSRPTDGPGSLNNFVGELTASTMPWMLTMTDNSRNRTGRVDSLNIRVEPNQSILGTAMRVCVLANQWDYFFVDVPPDGSKLTVTIANNSAPVDLYIKRGVQPTATDYDKFALISPPGGSLSIGVGDVPPLNAGRYFIGVFNPNASTECFDILAIIDQDPAAVRAQTYLPTNTLALLDDAVTGTSIVVTNNRNVADVEVGLRVNHARASDLVFHLLSPQGTRILLAENRGHDNTGGYGLGSGLSTNAITNVVGTIMEDGFENAPEELAVPAGRYVSGWSVDSGSIDVLGPGYIVLGPAHFGTKWIDIQGSGFGIISTNINTTPGTPYRLSFAYTRNPDSQNPGPASATINVNGSTLLNVLAPVDNAMGNVNWKTTSVVFTASTLLTKLEVASATVSHPFAGVFFDTFKVEELSITTPLLYTIFTENTNLTTTPIKFGIAPFASTNGQSTNLVYTNSFEGIRPDDYCAVTNFGAWQLYSNHVTVVSNVLQSHSGTEFLELENGQALLTLPTSAGRQYQLQHVFRRDPPDPSLVSWWPAEGDANDVVSTNDGALLGGILFTNGIVGQAFNFDGINDYVRVAPSPSLDVGATNGLTLECWIRPADVSIPRPLFEWFDSANVIRTHFWISRVDSANGALYANLVDTNRVFHQLFSAGGLVNTNGFQHVALTYDKTSGVTRLYYNGAVVATTNLGSFQAQTSFPLHLGYRPGSAPYRGQMDEVDVWNRALSPLEIRAIYLAGVTAGAGKCGAQTLQFSQPVSWWPAEGEADDITDGNIGTLGGGVTFASGLVGRAFNFDGTGGVRINNHKVYFQTNLTMETWVFPTVRDGEMDTILYKEAETTNPHRYGMAIKGPLNVSCPGGTITNGHFTFALVGVAGLPNEFCGWVDGGGIVPTNQWSHLAVTFDGGTARAYVNGALTRTLTNLSGSINISSGNLWIGARSPVITGRFPNERFNGLIDEAAIYDHALDSCEIRDIYESNVKGKYSILGRPAPCPVNATLIVDDRLTNTFASSDWRTWQTNLMRFNATQVGTPIRLIGHEPEMQFDTFELSELSSGNYYLPEESLDRLLGESALGTWTLEVWDNRLGALVNPTPDLLSWRLQFIFSNTNPPAIPLTFVPPTTNVASVYNTNGILVTNTIVGGQMRYFIVDVPRRATIATNILADLTVAGGGNLALLYHPDRLPLPGDTEQDAPGGNEILVLNTNTPPVFPLRPGQRYYLGVTNKTIPSTNTFLISVAFDQTDTNLISVRTLTNGICYTATIPVTNALDYYQFNVSTNSTVVNFALSPANPDVNLVVRRALPVPDPLPRPNTGKFDYISVNGGITNDIITVTADSQPVPLSSGVWYLGVFNVSTNPVTYTICATESTNSLYNIIPLSNAVPLNYTIGAGSLLTNLFLFTIDQTNSAVLFELYNLNADAGLVGDLGTFPTPATAQFADFASPVRTGQIVVRTNDFFPTLNGNWYLAVDNLQDTNLTFTIRAVVSTNGVLSSGLPMNVVIGFAPPPDVGLQFTWYSVLGETYVIETSDDLVNWTLLDTIVAYSSYITYTDPAGGTQPYLFYRIRQVP